MIRQLAGGLLIGLTGTVFPISFVSIVYTGELSIFIDRGIGLVLISSAIMAGIGAMFLTFRGAVMHPQDVTAILLSGGASAIVSSNRITDPEVLFATVATLVALSTALAGIACFTLGYLRLSFVAKFLPYPVLGGFLAATGYLLVIGGITVATEEHVSLLNLAIIFEPGLPMTWLPWLLGACVTAWLAHRYDGGLVLPISFAVGGCGFFGALALFEITTPQAMSMGLMLGPFPDGGFLSDIDPSAIALVDWGAVLQQAPIILAVVAMTVLGGLLNVTGINHVVGNDGSLDKDLRVIGIGNLAASGAGGLVGYPMLGESILGYRIGLVGAIAGISVAILNLAAVFAGASILAVLPKGLFAMVLIYVGVDLMFNWLWQERKRLPASDFGIVLLILVTAATVGFLPALAVGVLVSMALFIVSYARLDFIRVQTTLANRRSMVERANPERAYLTAVGEAVIVIELTGFLFFGTATALRDRILGRISSIEVAPRVIVIDMRRVRDIDASATMGVQRTVKELADLGVRVVLTGVNNRVKKRFTTAEVDSLVVSPTLDEALQALETELLLERPETRKSSLATETFLEALERMNPTLDLEAHFSVELFQDGEPLIRQGSDSDDIFILTEGQAQAVIVNSDNESIVAQFLPGALLGEMAFYGAAQRSASVLALGPVRALRIDAKQLGPESELPATLVASFHFLVARFLSQRLQRSNRLLVDAEM